MALGAIVADPDAAMLTAGADCAAEGFVTSKLKVYVVPAIKVCPLCTVSLKVPELNAPLDCVDPSENTVSPSSPSSCNVTEADATALLSPEIVTTELLAAARLVSTEMVTVMRFALPAAGVLCPMALVEKLCEDAVMKLPAKVSKISILIIPRPRF